MELLHNINYFSFVCSSNIFLAVFSPCKCTTIIYLLFTNLFPPLRKRLIPENLNICMHDWYYALHLLLRGPYVFFIAENWKSCVFYTQIFLLSNIMLSFINLPTKELFLFCFVCFFFIYFIHFFHSLQICRITKEIWHLSLKQNKTKW